MNRQSDLFIIHVFSLSFFTKRLVIGQLRFSRVFIGHRPGTDLITESDHIHIVLAVHSCSGRFSTPLGSLSSFRFSLDIQFCLSRCWGWRVAGFAYFISGHKETQLNRV